MQDYRSEVKEVFAADEQLAAEVEYNLKMFEKQKEQEQQELEQKLSSFTLSPRTKVRHTFFPLSVKSILKESRALRCIMS